MTADRLGVNAASALLGDQVGTYADPKTAVEEIAPLVAEAHEANFQTSREALPTLVIKTHADTPAATFRNVFDQPVVPDESLPVYEGEHRRITQTNPGSQFDLGVPIHLTDLVRADFLKGFGTANRFGKKRRIRNVSIAGPQPPTQQAPRR